MKSQRVYEACRSHMRRTDIVIYESYSVETANDALIKQVVLFLDPQLVWADDAIYVRRVREDP